MFAPGYFAPAYFAPSYFPPGELEQARERRGGRIKWRRNVRDDQDLSEVVEILLISGVMDLE